MGSEKKTIKKSELRDGAHRSDGGRPPNLGKKKTVSRVPWWRRIVGKFKDDPVFDEVVKEMDRRRDAERPALQTLKRKKSPHRNAAPHRSRNGAN
jgi:hypothetical protein